MCRGCRWKTMLEWKPKGKRAQGRPALKWKLNIDYVMNKRIGSETERKEFCGR